MKSPLRRGPAESPPASPEEGTYLARHLDVTLRLALVALAAGGLIAALAGFRTAWGVFAAIAPVAVALHLTRRGRLEAASAVLVPSMLALVTWLVHEGNGLQDITLLVYPVIVLVAGLLMPRRPFVVVVVLALASLGFVAWGQLRGTVFVFNEATRSATLAYLLLAWLVISVAAAIVHTVAEDLRASLHRTSRSEQRYRLISEVSTDYTFSTVVDRDGRVRQDWVAGAFERMTGYGFEEYMARGGWRAALHPDDVAEDDRAIEALKRNEAAVSVVRTVTRGGEVRWVRVYARPVWNGAENRLTGIYGAVRDITEAKQAQNERETLIRELEAKNAELERFTYTASHDLKSPLVTIRGFLGFLERDARSGNLARLEADLGRIQAATDKMGILLDELLQLSRVGRVVNAPGPVPLGELAAEAVALLAGPIAERGVEVRIQQGLPPVWGDRTRLLQVLQNLVENAVKFSADPPRRVEIGARSDGGAPVFYVRDNGIGIETSHLERVFGLFDKLDPKTAGAGVGLALVRRIVELHGGRVWVESEGCGRGATSCFTLPPPPAGPGGQPAAGDAAP
jgi:PAS domain S-box-containing protein